jgi:hypothetical protein
VYRPIRPSASPEPNPNPSQVSYGVPTYQTLLTVLTIIAGGFFFDEFSVMPPKDVVWFSFESNPNPDHP